ncbi:MFS transporter [Oceanobacillus sp. CF4.6]|uniref:MFS transporter n=1 Tax=Oceanobacillus sp. CF4.6 TaxID=3373080 RepID=UPI003EE479BB
MRKSNLTLTSTSSEVQSWKMMTWLLVTQVLVAFVGRSLAPLGVLIGEDLSLTNAQIGMLPAALFLGQSLASIPAGFLVDKTGSKKILLILSLCLGLSFILMTLTSVYLIVLIMIMIGGVGYGAMHPTSNKGIINWFTKKKRGTAMGIKQMGVTLGSALAALLLLPLASIWGWRPVVIFACLLLIMMGILAYKFYYDPPQEKTMSIEDTPRLLASIYSMFKCRPLIIVSLGAMGLNGSQLILNTYIVLFAYKQLGISLFLSGILLVISEVSGSLGRVVWGIVSDNFFHGKRIIVLIIISILSGISSFVIAILPHDTPFWIMVPIIIVFGFCISGFNGIWMNVATELVPSDQAGIASGFSLTLASFGVIVGPPIFGFIVDSTGTFTFGWLFIGVVMMGVILLLSLAMAITPKRNAY